jgi:hypothetical protein
MYYPGDDLTWDDILHPENLAGKPARRANPPQPLPPPRKMPCRDGLIPAIYQDLLTNDPPRRIWYDPKSRSSVGPPTPSPSRSPSPAPSPFNIVEYDLPMHPGANRPLPSTTPASQHSADYRRPYRRPFSPSSRARGQPRTSTTTRLTDIHEGRLKLPPAKPASKLVLPTEQAQPQCTRHRTFLMPSMRRFHSSSSYFDTNTRDLSSLDTVRSPTLASTVNGDDEDNILELDTPGAREASSWIFPLTPKEENSSSDSEDNSTTCDATSVASLELMA